MIDEKKLIQTFESLDGDCNLFRWRSADKIKSGIIRIINEQPKIGEWIQCSERLPEDSETMVLVQVSGRLKNLTFEDALELASYNPDDGWTLDAYPEWEYAQPTAWMPLPEPYKEV